MKVLFLPLILWARLGDTGEAASTSQGRCEPIKIDMCRFLGYNQTRMPNLATHSLQADAEFELETFAPLIQIGCSNELPFFLCAVYVPMCSSDVSEQPVIGPCRPLCLKVRRNCEPVIREIGYSWPAVLNCSKFHAENNDRHMCMRGPGDGHPPAEVPLSALNTFQTNPLFREKVKEHFSSKFANKYKGYKEYVKLLDSDLSRQKPATSINLKCRHLKRSSKYLYIQRFDTCVPKCLSDVLFESEQKEFTRVWIAVWSSMCFASTLFTLASYCLDPGQYPFPEKSVIFLTLCFAIHSLGYLLRLSLGRFAITCQPSDSDPDIYLLTREGTRNEYCVIVFLMTYYTFQAASTWWTAGTLAWLLTNFNLNVDGLSPWYHFYAWGVPAVQSVAALILRKVDASELTGLCSVGNQNENSLLLFEVIPETAQLILNLVLFSTVLIISTKKQKVFSKMGVFWILYTLPKVCVVGCLYYEYVNRQLWLDVAKVDRPNVEIFMLRICMSLVIGITTGYWIWSQKTWEAWKRFGKSCLGFWRREKKPPTPTFPTVYYRPQPIGEHSDSKSNGTIELQRGPIVL